MELCPAMRASVKASHPLSASIVRGEGRRQYGSRPFHRSLYASPVRIPVR